MELLIKYHLGNLAWQISSVIEQLEQKEWSCPFTMKIFDSLLLLNLLNRMFIMLKVAFYSVLLFGFFRGTNGQIENQWPYFSAIMNTSSCIPKPFSCPHPNIQYFLYTRRSQENPELIDITSEESLYQSQFNRLYQTKIVIHGFRGGRNVPPSTIMRDAYFLKDNYNIFIIDYGTLAAKPCLKQMQWAPNFCAFCISRLIRYLALHPRGIKAEKMHLIGYSVGAHIAGLVANYIDVEIDGKIGRITGLDPTIIFYAGSDPNRDLDAGDANFVDVLHTNSGILGQWGPNGHADFYINGGTKQPRCKNGSLFENFSCDHTIVTPYFIESIITPRGFWAYSCPSFFSYFLGICNPSPNDFVLMGEHVDTYSARGTYYVKTNAEPPFAQGFLQKV